MLQSPSVFAMQFADGDYSQSPSMDIHLSRYHQEYWVLEASPCILFPQPNKDHLALRLERGRLGVRFHRLSNRVRLEADISSLYAVKIPGSLARLP